MKPKPIPTPEMLLVEAEGALDQEAPLSLFDYGRVIDQLRDKNYSFGKIAEWLSERLGRPINKGGVYRAYSDWLEDCRLQEEHGLSLHEVREHTEDEGTRIVDDLAEELGNYANSLADERGLPREFATEAMLRMAKIIERERADEKAAEDADKKSDSPAADNDANAKSE